MSKAIAVFGLFNKLPLRTGLVICLTSEKSLEKWQKESIKAYSSCLLVAKLFMKKNSKIQANK